MKALAGFCVAGLLWPALALGQGATLEKIAGESPAAPAAAGELTAPEAGARVWESRSTGIREAIVSAAAMSPSDPRTILAATSRGVIYRSSDGGRSWDDVLRIKRNRNANDTPEVNGQPTDSSGLTDEQEAQLDDLRQQTIDDVVADLTESVGADEAEREAEDQAETAVEEATEDFLSQNVAQTDSTEDEDANGPPARSAAVRQISWDPTFPGLAYAATRDGVYRTGDYGESWTQIAVGVGDDERDAICIAPSAGNSDRILVGTGTGLFVTNDGGIAWSKATGEIANLEVRALAIDPEHRGTIAVGTVNGAFLSVDGGDTFRRVYSDAGQAADIRSLAFAPGDSSDLYEGTANGLFLITPEGASPVGVGQFRAPAIRAVIAPGKDTDRVYVATARGVYESRDRGKSFAELYEGLSSPDAWTLAEDVSTTEGVFAATTLGLFKLVPERATLVAVAKLGGLSPAELLHAAARYGSYDSDRLSNWRQDARWTAYLPDVVAEYRKTYVKDLSTGYAEVRDTNGVLIGRDPSGDSYPYNKNDLFLVTFTWRFDQIFSNAALHSVEQQLAQIGRARSQRLSKVARLARERKEVADKLAGATDDEDRNALQLRLQELDAYLDAATGGAITSSRRP